MSQQSPPSTSSAPLPELTIRAVVLGLVLSVVMGAANVYVGLKAGMTVLECSTGNAGIACSFVSAAKGYKCIIVMPEGMSEERKKLDIAYGSEMIYTPGGESDVDLGVIGSLLEPGDEPDPDGGTSSSAEKPR